MQVARVIDRGRFHIHFIGIDKEGAWNFYDPVSPVGKGDHPREIHLAKKGDPVNPFALKGIDVVFPTLHGPLGEDGTVQGLLRLANIPFVGADVLASAMGMDKDIAKRLVCHAKLPTAPWVVLKRGAPIDSKHLSYPLFVKPATAGSSIGISKVYEPSGLLFSVERAFEYDEKVILEEGLIGREIQVALMGNQDPSASLPCEIIPKGEFHTYESKYIDEQAAEFLYPAPLEADETQRVKEAALKIYELLCCEGFARVDFFLSPEGTLFFNEINTIPGLTEMSPYAKMWQSSGVSFGTMVDRLIAYALQRHEAQSKHITSYEALTPT